MPRSVSITLDKERNLLLDFNAIADAGEVAGKEVMEFITGESVSFPGMRALLWAGLKHEDPKLTVRATGDLIQAKLEQGDGIPALAASIWAALIASGIGKKKDDDEKNESAEKRVLNS